MDFALDRRTVQRKYLHAVAGDFHHITFVQIHHLVGDLDQCLGIGTKKVLANAQAHQQRRATASADHAIGFITTDHRDGIRAVKIAHRSQYRLTQAHAGADVLVDQHGHDFGISFRGEHVAARLQLLAQCGMVFDDAVVHDCHAAGHMRVRVGLVRRAMRGPACVRNAGAAGKRIGQVQRFHLAHFALGAHAPQLAGVQHGQTGRVVATVLERLEADDQQRCHIALGYGSNYSAHEIKLLVDKCEAIAPHSVHADNVALPQAFTGPALIASVSVYWGRDQLSIHLAAQVVQQINARDQAEEALPIHHDGDVPALKHGQQCFNGLGHLQLVHLANHGSRHLVVEACFVGVHMHQYVRLVHDTNQLFTIDHRQLRHIVEFHARVGGDQQFIGPDHDGVALRKRTQQQITQIAVLLVLDEAVVEHPVIVVQLGQTTRFGVVCSRQYFSAAATSVPVDEPPSTPSLASNSRAVRKLSLSEIG